MINISIEEIKQVCNLEDLKKTEILTSKFPLIDALISDITIFKEYRKVIRGTAEQIVNTSFRHAFAYFLYAECIDFLNTSTSGTGIIRSTGYADSRMELLSQDETEKKQRRLELKAYTLLLKYLNPKGLKRYNELKLWDDLQRAENEEAKQRLLSEGRICRMAIV
jgi:hypothetical protein